MSKLMEGEDFYYNELGYVVLTEKYHLERGICCGNGCRHCPYQYINVPEPKRSELASLGHSKAGVQKNC
jgi:Family of unknown function (DUF5522)